MDTEYTLRGKKIYQYIYQLIDSNMYVIVGDSSAVVIDAVISEEAVSLLKASQISKVWMILTHEHYDHIQGVNFFRGHFECCVMGSAYTLQAIRNPRKNLAYYIDSLMLARPLDADWREKYQIPADYSCKGDIAFKEKRDSFSWEGITFDITETPGHSGGSICIAADDHYYFTGDSLVDGADIILRLPGGSRKDYKSITKPYLESIEKDSLIFPGHGKIGKMFQFHIC